MKHNPCRGDVWLANLNGVRSHEQAGKRPVLILSVNEFNQGPAGVVNVLPLTTRDRGIPFHIPLTAPEGGIKHASFAMCDAIRSISRERLNEFWGTVRLKTMMEIEDKISILYGLGE